MCILAVPMVFLVVLQSTRTDASDHKSLGRQWSADTDLHQEWHVYSGARERPKASSVIHRGKPDASSVIPTSVDPIKVLNTRFQKLVVTKGLPVGADGLYPCMAFGGTNGVVNFCAHFNGMNLIWTTSNFSMKKYNKIIWDAVDTKVAETGSSREFKLFAWGSGSKDGRIARSLKMEKAITKLLEGCKERGFQCTVSKKILFEQTDNYQSFHSENDGTPRSPCERDFLDFGAITSKGELLINRDQVAFVDAYTKGDTQVVDLE